MASDDLDLSDEERDALDDVTRAVEHLERAYGALLTCHHETGHAMDQLADAEDDLRAAGHEAFADRLRDDLLPTGAVGDRWTFEVVEGYRDGLLADVTRFGEDLREDLADGLEHVAERDQKRAWRERAGDDP